MVVPLALALERRRLRVWLDKMTMQIGDSIAGKIDEGLANSRFGVVIVSPAFLSKKWPKRELDALAARETETGEVVVLPVWHGITYDEVAAYSPTLASKLAAHTRSGIEAVAEQIEMRCKNSSTSSSSQKQSTIPLERIPEFVREILLERPQPSGLRVIPRYEVWREYCELHTLRQDEDLIAIWEFEKFSLVSKPSNLAFTSKGLRIFYCNMFTNWSKRRLFISYKEFREYRFAIEPYRGYQQSADVIRIDGPQEWHASPTGRLADAGRIIVQDLNRIRDMTPEL